MSSSSIAQYIKEHYPEYWGDQTYPKDKSVFFNKKTDSHWILSNFAKVDIIIDDVLFKNSEHLFQTMKFCTEESILKVYYSSSPKMTAKHYQKLGGHRRNDWGEIIIDALKFCLQQKYVQCPEFKEELQNTRGYYIVELEDGRQNKRPDAWGVKTCGEFYIGPNIMGRLLMDLRDNGKLDYRLPDDITSFINTIVALK